MGVIVLLAVVIKVDREEGRVGVSLREDRLEESQEGIRLVRWLLGERLAN